MNYRERPTVMPGVMLWSRVVERGSERSRILPDGCLDLIWDGRHLFVAGPDSTARWHHSPAGTRFTALRFSAGSGPVILAISANEVRDQNLTLAQLWPSADARILTERVAVEPAVALAAFAAERAACVDVDGFGPRVLAMATAGLGASVMADRLSISTRQLHRRCLPTFGYGPRRLTRVIRMHRAIDLARTRCSLAQVATDCGYADQAHLCREVRELAGTTPTALFGELDLR